jgi:hypothetical protein
MSFSRIKYDENAYNEKLNREVAQGDYRLFKGYNENCNKCNSFDGPRNSLSEQSIPIVDKCENELCALTYVESLLQNRVNKLIDSNDYGKNDEYKNYPVVNKLTCDDSLNFEDTRFTYPIEAFRCMDTSQYHYSPFLSTNPQCEIQSERIGSNTRLTMKDTWKMKTPKLIDQSCVLPDSTNNNVEVNFCKQ